MIIINLTGLYLNRLSFTFIHTLILLHFHYLLIWNFIHKYIYKCILLIFYCFLIGWCNYILFYLQFLFSFFFLNWFLFAHVMLEFFVIFLIVLFPIFHFRYFRLLLLLLTILWAAFWNLIRYYVAFLFNLLI